MIVQCVLIARDNAGTIDKAVRSIRNHVDGVLVVLNAQSSDETGDIAQSAGAEVVRGEPFRDFSQARNDALSYARGRWILSLDSDDWYGFEDDFSDWPTDVSPARSVVVAGEGSGMLWDSVKFFQRGLTYKGKCHELVDYPGPAPLIDKVLYYRTKPSDPIATGLRNLALLAGETDARSTFLTAMAEMDVGRREQARETFRRRAAMDGWDEETFYAALQVARLTRSLGEDPVQAYMAACQLRPKRAEPYVELSAHFRASGQLKTARDVAEIATKLPICVDRLLIDVAAHTWQPRAYLKEIEEEIAHSSHRHNELISPLSKRVSA